MGEKTATCGCRAFPGGPQTFVYGVGGRTGEGGGFQVLGVLIAYDDADTQAMRLNLRKARGCWAWISRVLRAENATARMCRMFYKATVQAVLLYGSETWSLSPMSVKRLEGFHIHAAWRMSGMRPEKKPDGSWSYPRSKDVLEAAGLQTIAHYMDVRRQTVANFIVSRPIWELCAGAVRRRGLLIQPFWCGASVGGTKTP
jgi:hypothetical protein